MARSSKEKINSPVKKDEIYKKIDKASEILGLSDDEKTIFEITNDPQTNEKKLVLKSGSWEQGEPWFGIDEKGELHTMVSIKSLSNLIQIAKNAMKENFDLKLEKSIWQHVPVDFGDVWVVCMDEIRKITAHNPNISRINIDLDSVVDNVKKEHPNLFVDIKEFFEQKGNISED